LPKKTVSVVVVVFQGVFNEVRVFAKPEDALAWEKQLKAEEHYDPEETQIVPEDVEVR